MKKSWKKLKSIIQQEKDSIALKQLGLEIASEVLHDKKLKAFLKTVMNNYRKNKRLGIVTFD